MKKQIALDTINELPQDFELDDLFERLILLEKIEKGKEDMRTGNYISHEQAKEKLGKWMK